MDNVYITIGLEVHCQLSTKAKMFCRCGTDYIGTGPNSFTCPICLGLPGSLPVLNHRVLDLALQLALALDCRILPTVVFHRKNYFYPDLPKGYQISQFDFPIGVDGTIDFASQGQRKSVRVKRVHVEEDAGKLVHEGIRLSPDHSGVDFNRSGIPLAEIVTEPDIHTPEEARECLMMFRSLVRYLGVSDGNMEEGSLRCDANVSIAHNPGEVGVKVEVKNMNSFRSVYRALSFEVERQTKLLSEQKPIVQETRHWDEMKHITIPSRSKEEAEDYRYFPDPDLLPFSIDEGSLETLREKLPELPLERKERFMLQHELTENEAGVLASSKMLADFFEECLKELNKPKTVCNWIMTEVLRNLKSMKKGLSESELTPKTFIELLRMVDKKEISGTIAKSVLEEMFASGMSAREVIAKRGISFLSNEKELESIVLDVIEKNPQSVADYLGGKEKAFHFLVGQVMRQTRGQASPEMVKSVLHKQLSAGG